MEGSGNPNGATQLAPSSAQIQSALDQLTYLQRILHGDNEMSLNDLLASASASGPSSSLPLGGLSKALATLLAPLLSNASTAPTKYGSGDLGPPQPSLLDPRSSFQPRRYLAMTSELVSRMSDEKGEMYKAIQLAHLLMNQSDEKVIKDLRRQRILQERKQKKLMIDQQQLQTEQATNIHETSKQSNFHSTSSFIFPSTLHGQAKEMEPRFDLNSDDLTLQAFLRAWQTELSMVDREASERVDVKILRSIHDERGKRYLLKMEIDQTGCAWLWLRFEAVTPTEWCCRIDWVNLLAESEVEESRGDLSLSVASQSSKFPLYRRITSLLHTKLIQLAIQKDNLWAHLTTALFALATLCRLNSLRDSTTYNFSAITSLRGQESILNALVYFDVSSQKDEAAEQGEPRGTNQPSNISSKR